MSMGVAILMFCGENMMVRGQVGCRGDMQGLIKQCAVYVQKGTPMGDPSEACCTIVRGVDIPCVCQRLSKEIEPMVDMDKVFHVVNFCGRPLAHGTAFYSPMKLKDENERSMHTKQAHICV
ncbi:hypothetical protein FNV43_RR20203 [Rhamnella rubrinervis]|uniref:Bifunctional inhibitor/plant lipid transfer protein/seed storage helical domain-containing protein n=1 Tax=Rhamnella rubrinervis TaxID=2594499 RepID=A0A8K0DUE0_9ROSA|nr:hypothetical protein FNV43_RR20203 [Rhamnella rubrinervis]